MTQQWGPPQPTGQWTPQPGWQPAGQQWPPPGQVPPGGFRPAPRRRNPLRSFLLAVMMIIGISLLVVSVLGFLFDDSEYADAPSQPEPGVVVPTTAPEPQPPTVVPSAPTKPSAPPQPELRVPPPDKNPSPIPQPETYSEATELLTNNPVYTQAVQYPTRCALPAIDMTRASKTELTDHLNDLTACLWLAWAPPIHAVGFEMPRPPVTVYNEPITTGCGKLDDVNAVYCAADQRVYYAKPLYQIFPAGMQQDRFVIETVLAHEFGHAIQARTGILVSSMAWEQKSSKTEARGFSRRLEVQADCFAGMFASAVAEASGMSDPELANLTKVMYTLGDDVLSGVKNIDGDHGLGKTRGYWTGVGLTNTGMGKCNTFVAPDKAVR